MSDWNLPRVPFVTVGTVGEPGQRVFYLQVDADGRPVAFKLEKAQVRALAGALAEVLTDLPAPDGVPTDLELREPVDPDFVVGSIAISPWDAEENRLFVVLEELVAEDAPEGSTARIGLALDQVAALAIRGVQLVEAGRPPCPLCGGPMDPSGHVCPKSNGHLKH
ncbi:MAG TPA: DUF3090 family protein [Acidimicrobiales bacterium]|nr:DUF3090 family protein [Acidimicrobiales bacterium]